MKKTSCLLLLLFSTAYIHAQTLFTFGTDKVSKDEFVRAYNKNKTPVENQQQSMREYLDLYINFKLKVKSALTSKFDTLPQLQSDLATFRQQIQEGYVSDPAESKRLYQEAFDRCHKDLHVLYFSIADNGDSITAAEAANQLSTQLQKGNTDYEGLLTNVKAKGMSAKKRDLGFLTVFSVSYAFENIIYSLQPGEVSKPYHYKNAWHVFKLLEEREAAGKWKVAQIMLALPPNPSPEAVAVLQKKADSVYGLLKGGADFAAMAKNISEDKLTYSTGGEMNEFSTGRYEYDFEKEVFALKQDGDLSKPFRTSQGFHIVKRLSQTPVSSDSNDASLIYELKQRLQEDARINAAREKLAAQIMKAIDLKRVPGISDADLVKYADSVIRVPETEDDKLPISKKTLLSYKTGTIKGNDWLRFVRYSNLASLSSVQDQWPKYMIWTTLNYYRDHLEQYNDEFRYQMQEFREGNILFEAMERNVWGKAASDSAGLQKHYLANKSKYTWDASALMLIVNAPDADEASIVLQSMKSGKDWHEIIEESEGIQIDSGRYEISQISALNNGQQVEEGAFSAVLPNPDNTASFVYVLRKYPAGQQRSFEDARGLVINDYQAVLEKKWLDELKKKYPVKVNDTVLNELMNAR